MAYARTLEEWNPMAESYHDANINSYETGPGANLTPHIRSPGANSEYKLYVTEIPPELSETGIRQIFKQYGTVLGVYSPVDANWAFVTYGSFREAEAAIRDLNHKDPLSLKVEFAKKKETNSNKKNQIQYGIPNIESAPHPNAVLEQRVIHNRPVVRNLGRGRELADLARRVIPSSSGPMYHETDDLLYPAIHDPNLYDPYEDAEPYAETNNMWARGRLQISNNGTRYVSMGRGSTWYELPTTHPRVHDQIRAVYENRRAGLYEYGENKLAQQIGKCQNCAKKAVMRCQRCREFYCSRACQENDWPRHKIECQPMPNLVEVGADLASLSISSEDEVQQHMPARPSTRKNRLLTNTEKLRRPLEAATLTKVPNFTSTPVPGTSPIPEMPVAIPEGTSKSQEIENEPVRAQLNAKRNHTGDQKQVLDRNRLPNNGGWNPMKGDSNSQLLRHSTNLPVEPTNQKPSFSNGLPPSTMKQGIEAKQESNKSSTQGSVDNNHAVHQNATTSKQVIETHMPGSQINKSCFKTASLQRKNYCESDDQGKTARNLSDPDVSFHRVSNVRENSTLKPAPKAAFPEQKIDAVAGPSGTQFILKTTPNDVNREPIVQNTSKVESMNPLAASMSPPRAGHGLKNVIDLIDVGEQGCFEVHILLGSNKAAVTICVEKFQEEYAKISSELTPECEQMPKPVSFKPNVGDYVTGKRLEDWIRGTVASLGPPMRLIAIDEGRVELVTDLKPVPRAFGNLPTLGVICELIEGNFKLEAMERYTFAVVNKKSQNNTTDGVEINLYSVDGIKGKGLLTPWTPAPEQRGIPYATLQSGTEVCIASFRSHVLIFARSLVPEKLQIYHRLVQDVAHCAATASKLTEVPIIGEMIIAKYAEDGNFYRAIVRKIHDSNITVSYVDYGNIEITTLDNLRPITPKLKEYPSCAAKIILKDVPKDVPMNKEVNTYLGTLAGTEEPLMCTFEGCPSEDGVILKAADGSSVNKKIVELLTPSWKKEEDKTTVFTMEDIDVAELGVVGATTSVLTLFSYGPLLHAMAPQDIDLIEHVTGLMASQMMEYCEGLNENYIPRQSEMCLAPYEGLWYRALCLVPDSTATTAQVNFIDFGNIEDIAHTDLRLITRDFMSTSALASLCSVVGLGPIDNEGNLPDAVAARVTELMPPNRPTLIKIIRCTRPGEYVVELPEVQEILIREGLLNL